MDLNSVHDLKRLEKQIFQYKPTIKSIEKKKYVSDRLRNQLLQSKAVVKIQRLDAECESLMISLKKRLMLLQDFIIPNDKEANLQNSQEVYRDEFQLNLSCESSDDETLDSLMSKQKGGEMQDLKMFQKDEKIKEIQQADTSEDAESHLPLALRRKPRERRLSYKSYSSASTSRSKTNRTKLQKQKHAVTTSVEEHLVEQEEVDAPTLHIKIPSLYRGTVHCVILDSLNFGRKIFDYRANEAKEQQQKAISRDLSKQLKCASAPDVQQDQDFELSQFIQDVMAEACNEETLQATNALESINNNLTDNYDLVGNDTLINYSQSSKEFSYSQNSNRIVDTVCSTSEGTKVRKKRKYTKRSNVQQQNEPPKKRGRKKKIDSNTAQLQPQPPTKSNLAQYVERFSNDCDLLPPGSTTPAASSTRSQPLVSSTTHNFEVLDQLPQQEQQNSSQLPITYYIDGDWANGGPCQLVTTNGVSVDDIQLNQDDNVPVRNFVNYIENSGDSRSNIIATVLECNNSLPISIPHSITNFEFQNKNHQPTQQVHNQSTVKNSLLPIINIQIPPLPNNVSASKPPTAHVHKEVVVDLSIKSNTRANITSNEGFNFITKSNNNLEIRRLSENDDCVPLDLSAKGGYDRENNSVIIDTQDEDFIRRLIEQSDFDYVPEQFKKGGENENASYHHENNKSFKEALDMPLLDFDATDFAQLQQNILTDKIVYNDSKNNEDSNFASMTAVDSSMGNNLNFSDQSTTEIFNKLLDNHFLNDINNEIIANDNLNETVFDQSRVDISTICAAVENPSTQKNQLHEAEKEVLNATSENSQEIENTSNDEPSSSTSLAVQLDSSSNTATDMSLNIKLSDNDSIELNNLKLTQKINLKSPSKFKINNEICNNAQTFLPKDEEGSAIKVGNSKTISGSNRSDANDVARDKENVFESTISKSPLDATKNYSDLNDKCSSEGTKSTFNTNNNDTNDKLLFKESDAKPGPSLDYSHVKSGENVVFSVAKITLSEDDNIYSSDSDSGKPCDLSTVKTMDNDNNIKKKTSFSYNLTTESSESFKDNSGHDKEDLNLYNNEVEKLQNVDQELAGISKNIECTKVKNVKNETKGILDSNNSNISNEKLSLLELESNLECPLDFDEDFDDALSLATSCFDSPNDDRFEGAIVDINTSTTTNTLQDLQQHEISPNPPEIKDLKPFKIPKLSNNSTDSIMVPNISEGVKFDNSSPTKTRNIAKLTRTISTDANVMLKEIFLGKGKTIAEIVVHKIFGISCLPFLADECNEITHCQLSHQLNDTEKVYRNLHTLDKTHANLAYQVVYNHSKLFKVYFNIFCTYYTKKNDRAKLLNMVNDCERYPEYAEFIIAIYEGLVECGLSRINACRLILKCIREKSTGTSIVEALVAIIMRSDWTMFTDFIKKFTEDMYQFKFRIYILEQMAPAVLKSKGPHLKQVFGKCFQTLGCDEAALLLNSPILIQCVSLLTNNT